MNTEREEREERKDSLEADGESAPGQRRPHRRRTAVIANVGHLPALTSPALFLPPGKLSPSIAALPSPHFSRSPGRCFPRAPRAAAYFALVMYKRTLPG